MGDSKVVMLSAIYLIAGMFLYSGHLSKMGERDAVRQAENHRRAEMIAREGISLALNTMGENRSMNAFPPVFREMKGGRVSVFADRPLGASIVQSRITVIAVSGTDTVTMTAIATFDRGRWRLSGVFHLPAA